MKLLTLEGTFHDGRIDLTEVPVGLGRAKVLVTFLDTANEPGSAPPRLMTAGMFSGPHLSTEDDFRAAELEVKSEETHGG